MTPENTADRDPIIHLLGAMSDGTDKYITDMEAAGQRQIVHSDTVPTRGSDRLAEFGFTLGEPDKRDNLFRPATLPDGWKRQGSDHAMWSYIVDDLGRRRVAIFYKAAFYDRDAFCRVETVGSYAYELLDASEAPVFDDTWCTRDALREALAEIREQRVERVQTYERSTAPWAAEELPRVRAQVAQLDAYVAKHLGGESS